jgi:hypothetical protein
MDTEHIQYLVSYRTKFELWKERTTNTRSNGLKDGVEITEISTSLENVKLDDNLNFASFTVEENDILRNLKQRSC